LVFGVLPGYHWQCDLSWPKDVAKLRMSKRGLIAIVFVVLVLVGPAEAYAWGPATHVKLASDVLGCLPLLPAAVAAILARYRKDYIFGNIAADVVVAKRLSRIKQVCHHWTTGFAILADATTDRGKAFALGYLSHLAADTVAHGKFLPRQMTLTRTTMSFGHLYWELRADTTIGPYYWSELRGVLREVFDEHGQVLSARLTDTFLPFSLNWRLFYRVNRFVSRHTLRWAMDSWLRLSRWQLSDQLMREYRAECLDRILDVLKNGRQSRVCYEDPNGNAALAYTRMQRRQLRQMARLGLISPHILYEVSVVHAPAVSRLSLTAHTPPVQVPTLAAASIKAVSQGTGKVVPLDPEPVAL